MKNHKNKFFLFLLIGLGIISCKKQEIHTFSGKNQIIFDLAYGYSHKDSILVSFGFDDQKKVDTLLNIVVRTQGFVMNTDRVFDLKIVEGSTAIAGTHYKIPKTLKILKDSVKGYIPLTIYRTPDMKTKIFSLKMKLIPNKNFKTNFYVKAKRKPDTKELSFSEFEIQITDQLLKPAEWDWYVTGYLGAFSIKKLFLYAKVRGIQPKDWNKGGFSSITSWAIVFKNYLLEQKEKGTPVKEKDGTEMKLGRWL